MDISRRSFVGGALAFGAWGAAAGTAAPHMESRHLGGERILLNVGSHCAEALSL